jgi:UDP-N-acetylglucosamine 2-epimerase (non-hydrolysing)
LFVVGARPNFPKVAPILAALSRHADVEGLLCHTGQHYDPELSGMFFEDLGITAPVELLGVGSGTHAQQTAAVMTKFEAHLLDVTPDAVVVVGDVNSTLACSLVATKMHIPVAHVEAGLRSGDRSMPEEINRLVTDTICDRLYTHCREADENLAREGVPPHKVVFAGNVMIDSLLRLRPRAVHPKQAAALDLKAREYGLVTLHRPALVDHRERFGPMLDALVELSRDLPLLYPVHPRSFSRLQGFGFIDAEACLDDLPTFQDSNLRLCPSLRYLQFLWLMDRCRVVITDSGGIQEETAVLGVPCITVRDNTERAVTIRDGTNQLVGVNPTAMLEAARRIVNGPRKRYERVPELWDGRAGERIAADLVRWLRPALSLVASA